MDSKEKKSSAK